MERINNFIKTNLPQPNKPVGGAGFPPPLPPPPPSADTAAATFTPQAEQPNLIQKPQVVGPAKQPNQVSVEKLQSVGSESAFKAILPSVAGGGAFLPVAVAFVKENVGGQTRTSATLVDDQGHRLLGQDQQPVNLNVYQIDDKYLIATNNQNPNASPYIVVEEDKQTGVISYGLAQGLTYGQGGPDSGYGLARTELIEGDGSRTLRANEHYGAKTKPSITAQSVVSDLFATGGLAMGSIVYDQMTGKTGRSAEFQEVRMGANGETVAADVKYGFLPTGERPMPTSGGLGQLGDVWKQVKGTSRETFPRQVMVTGQGDLQLVPSKDSSMNFNMSSLKGLFGSQTPRQTVVVRALTSDYVHNQAGADSLRQGMTGGQTLTPEA